MVCGVAVSFKMRLNMALSLGKQIYHSIFGGSFSVG
jgi:hypothetical protein